MYSSLEIMRGVPVNDLKGLSLEEVVFKFQSTDDKKLQNRCFAYVFCELFPMLLKLHHKFTTLTLTERTEECLCCTLHAMRKYGTKEGAKKMKFSSFLYQVLFNCLKGMVMRADKNNTKKVWNNLVDCDSKVLSYVINSIRDTGNDEQYNQYMLDLENSSILSKEEIEYCKALIEGYKNNKEIAEHLKIKSTVKYSKRNKKFITCPLDESGASLHISRIKKSIKEKIKQNNYSAI